MPQHHDPYAAPDPLTGPWYEQDGPDDQDARFDWDEPAWIPPGPAEPASSDVSWSEPTWTEPVPTEPVRTGPLRIELHEDEIGLLEESLRLLEGQADRLMGHFYATLFLEAPQLRALFPVAMEEQRDRFFRALAAAVAHFREPDRLAVMLRDLGRDHRKFGVRTEDYDLVGHALIQALRRFGEDVWVPELEAAWVRAYDVMADTMLAGAREAAVLEPAWWRGEVVAHERRAPDLAVLVVRPDRPYEYAAGQYASIETPYRPRSWRTYSMATAPSPDGLLEFHVRALDNGWVSGPLVWRAQVGDVLRLGAPQGDLRVDHDSRRDVLAVAGGTGLAPVKAILDDMTKWNTSRRFTLFFGARHTRDLYDMAALHRISALNPWFTVVPVVSEDPMFTGEQGLVADAVARWGRWTEHDVLVCGSPPMTRATFDRLVSLGVPAERIRYDVVGDAHPAAAEVIDLRVHQRESQRRRSSRPVDATGRPTR
jgi:NAD(P)H-flavin reductase/hemoglobin-like flavoprotein